MTVDEAFTMNKPSTYQFQMDGAGEHKLKVNQNKSLILNEFSLISENLCLIFSSF